MPSIVTPSVERNQSKWDAETMDEGRLFILVYGYIVSCFKDNNVCTVATNCLCAHPSVIWCSFCCAIWSKTPKCTLTSTLIIRNFSQYIIFFTWWRHQPIHHFALHDDVIKWKYFPRYWPFVRGMHRSPVNSPPKASDAELWCFLSSASE